jgi:hypothetical protein
MTDVCPGRFLICFPRNPSNIMIWNVRGLNSPGRQDAVRVLVDSAKVDIVCLQETKLGHVSRQLVLSMLGSEFDNNFVFLPSVGASGGILIAWRSRLGSLGASTVDHYCISI